MILLSSFSTGGTEDDKSYMLRLISLTPCQSSIFKFYTNLQNTLNCSDVSLSAPGCYKYSTKNCWLPHDIRIHLISLLNIINISQEVTLTAFDLTGKICPSPILLYWAGCIVAGTLLDVHSNKFSTNASASHLWKQVTRKLIELPLHS